MVPPDTIVPDPTNPQSFNRYSYVENRPINFNDPTGHCGADNAGDTWVNNNLTSQCIEIRNGLEEAYQIEIEGFWTLFEMSKLAIALEEVIANWFGDASLASLQGVTIDRHTKAESRSYSGCYHAGDVGCGDSDLQPNWIIIYAPADSMNAPAHMEGSLRFTVVHEIGHAFIKMYPEALEDFENFLGWEQNNDGTWNAPKLATEYGQTIARIGGRYASEEDFAEHLTFALSVCVADWQEIEQWFYDLPSSH